MSKTLKHYRQKKFLYRLLLRKSPRAGAMFGLAWMLMCLMLLPYGVFALLLLFSVEDWAATVPGAIVLYIAIYLYGVIVCAYGLAGILRDAFRTKWLCALLGFFGAWFTSLLGLALLPGLIRKRRYAAILFAVLGSAVYAAAGTIVPPGAGMIFGAAGLYLAALALSGSRGKFNWKFLYPLLIGVAAWGYLAGYDLKLLKDVVAERNAISQLIGQSVEVADFWKRNAQGFPLTREPLKTLLKEYEAAEQTLPGDPAETIAENRKLLAEYRSKHANLIAALERFLELPPAPIAHEYPEDGLFANIRLPELQMFRNSARYLAIVISAEPEAKQQVRKANIALVKLREWTREDNALLIAHLVAIAIEHIRLEALSTVLECGKYTEQEFVELVGDPVDWDRSMLLALGSEVTMFLDCVDHVLDVAACAGAKELIPILTAVKKRTPLALHIFFMRDSRFAMRGYRKMLAAIKKGEVPPPLDETEIKRNCYLLSGMLCPAFDRAAIRNARIADTRSMALLAAKVVEYRRRTGKLPKSLDFLPEVPIAKSVKTPFRLEKTDEGFRIVSDKDNREDDRNAVYPVRLDNK
jgi:hypothetical protein